MNVGMKGESFVYYSDKGMIRSDKDTPSLWNDEKSV